METLVIRTFDLETTDLHENGGVPIEAGYVDSTYERASESEPWHCTCIVADSDRTFFHPGNAACSIEARSTHHIKDSELAGSPHHSELAAWIRADSKAGKPSIYCAHNNEFEKKFVEIPEGCFWIDTYKLALRVTDFPKHNNQYLRYALGLELPDEFTMPPHRALPDAYTTAHILEALLKRASIKDAIRWTFEPPYLTKLTFGKHFGKRYEEVPRDYLQWLLRQTDMDAAVHAAAQRALNQP